MWKKLGICSRIFARVCEPWIVWLYDVAAYNEVGILRGIQTVLIN